ncbi:MAG: Nicotinate-nucleotide pyrophosphorylase (carboxylating) [Pelotomaculum sp. PtaB.Bin104]|nr:MAG: Nicotinate-nucleotide pyrophosphorylase (carboxylating) [Pelotomaculum sp. PtaB.Bin104]
MPYIDLTTLILDLAGKKGKIEFICREDAIICGTEEVQRIFKKLNINPMQFLSSGSKVQPQTSIIEGEGNVEDLHMAWRVSMNILEYASGIATRTNKILNKARQVNPKIEILATRKIFPGTKELSIKAVITGGGLPHRLGLSETILVFRQHLNFIGGIEGLIDKLIEGKNYTCDKKFLVEVETIDDALLLCQTGVDGLQFDKISPVELKEAVELIRAQNNKIVILAAGGINENNAELYAQTGVDGLVTSSVYFGKPVDMGTSIIQC